MDHETWCASTPVWTNSVPPPRPPPYMGFVRFAIQNSSFGSTRINTFIVIISLVSFTYVSYSSTLFIYGELGAYVISVSPKGVTEALINFETFMTSLSWLSLFVDNGVETFWCIKLLPRLTDSKVSANAMSWSPAFPLVEKIFIISLALFCASAELDIISVNGRSYLRILGL